MCPSRDVLFHKPSIKNAKHVYSLPAYFLKEYAHLWRQALLFPSTSKSTPSLSHLAAVVLCSKVIHGSCSGIECLAGSAAPSVVQPCWVEPLAIQSTSARKVLMGSWVCLVFSSTFGGFLFSTFHVAYMASQKRLNLNVHKSFWNLEELFTQVIYENLLSNFAVLGDKIRRRLKRATQCFGEVFDYLDGGLIFSIFLQQLWRNFDLGK